MLELSSDYTPIMSDFKVFYQSFYKYFCYLWHSYALQKKAEVISYCHLTNSIQLQLFENAYGKWIWYLPGL